MQANEKGLAGNLISANDLERILTEYLKTLEINNPRAVARLMIEQLRTRNFILCFLGADYYAFVHRTFLEYFCAWEFVWRFEKERSLTLDDLKTEVFGKHWQDESWHEVLRLIAGMIESKFVGEIINDLITQKGEAEKFINAFLAAECLVEVRNRRDIKKTAEQLLNYLKDLLKFGNFQLALEQENIEEAQLILEIHDKALSAVATTWQDDPDTLPMLKQWATSDDNWDVRLTAVRELAKGWKDHPDTLPMLKQWATSENGSLVRGAAVQELAKGWKDDPDTLPMLKQSATSDNNWLVRYAAVQELAKGWKDHPDTLPMLKQWATSDDDSNVRYAAVQELAKGWKDDPDTLPILKQRATSDDHGFVRGAAVQQLAKGWKDDPEIFELLCDRAISDPFERKNDREANPRQIALEAIIKQRPDSPQTLSLLRDRAENDPDEKLREFAQKKLEKWSKSRNDR
jgi:predicted NACHT family NTPase